MIQFGVEAPAAGPSADVADHQFASHATEVPFAAQSVISAAADGANSVFAADLDGDGDVDLADWSAFHAGLIALVQSPDCLDRLDADHDGGLDLAYIAGFQVRFTGP